MPVYVDPLMSYGGSATFRWNESCHLFADTIEELHSFAAGIGMKREWFQCDTKPNGRVFPHYDLNKNRRRIAVIKGAIELEHRAAHEKRVELGFTKKLPWDEVAKKGCLRDTDGDGNCSVHPTGCP